MAGKFKFTFGPWNIHEGSDPFGPAVRKTKSFSNKLKLYKKLGFDGVQFHDDDAVPDLNNLTRQQIIKNAKELRGILDDHGLRAEFVAPRLWEDIRTIDGGYTSNDPVSRKYAMVRSEKAIDIAKEFSTKNSGKFVNGVLDAILLSLKDNNKINKKGKGLLGEKNKSLTQ